MASPQVPPRPSRSEAPEATTSTAQAPTIPPRPAGKRVDRSESPLSGNHYPRSPFNESPFQLQVHSTDGASDLHRMASLNASRGSIDLPARPPSVSLPSIGQEGMEYEASTPRAEEEAVEESEGGLATSPTHTRKVSTDLPLHAPRPSLSSSDAKQRVAAVVRTDSNQAAAATGGKSVHLAEKPLRSKPSFNRPPSSSSYDRPGSSYEDEFGIPSFGQQVPLGHQYGDVQAPSPAPHGSQPHTPSTPGFERPSSKHHHRTKSGRSNFQAPPGSYGLHGHGQYENVDNFEKAWLQKHPEVLREEIAAHSPAILDRHDYNLTPEQLNQLVRNSKRSGFGASEHVSMPDEQIGYLASEAYASRNTTPKPLGMGDGFKPASTYAPHIDSPLRNPSISAANDTSPPRKGSIIHVHEPEHKESKHIGRGQVAEQEHVDLGPRGGNSEARGGWVDENGYGVPILASDEIDPTNLYSLPAVPPISENRRGSHYSADGSSSRPSSRPGSISNVPLHKTASKQEWEYKPLEDVREYEPLFPEDEASAKKPETITTRFKQRPDMRQRFPSKDIWEDAPASVNLEAEVDTPEPEYEMFTKPASVFETPEQEAERKGEINEAEKAKLLPKEVRLAQSKFQPHIRQEMRPSLAQQRFPSRDIWEDSPDSAYITTTVDEDQADEEAEEDEGIKAGAVVHTSSQLPREGATVGAPAIMPNINETPLVPPRPARGKSPAKEDRALPQIPARPVRRPSPMSAEADHATQDANPEKVKPSIPTRPSKSKPEEAATAFNPAARTTAMERGPSADAASKPKPQIPTRPTGSKIAALQAGFMSDLNKKLGLGPQVRLPQKDEVATEEKAEEEKKPLEDARKGRARGPARRKPAASPSAAATAIAQGPTDPELRHFVASPVMSLFDISSDGLLNTSHADLWAQQLASQIKTKGVSATPQDVPPAVGFNAQGEAVHAPTVAPEALAKTSQIESTLALQAEAEASGEPADLGHATTASASAQLESAEPSFLQSKISEQPALEPVVEAATKSENQGSAEDDGASLAELTKTSSATQTADRL